MQKSSHGGKRGFSTNGAGVIEHPKKGEKMKLDPNLTPYTKN